MNMRRKPGSQSGGGNFNQGRSQKQRFQGGGGGGGAQYNRPRKNYGQLREKYLAQARDALAAGDRVLAENYYQHADHCYRMLMEENANRPPQQRPQHNQQAQAQESEEGASASEEGTSSEEDLTPPHSSALPSFITGGYAATSAAAEAPAVQDWEERDQG
jgi:hypothetical protein